MDKIWSELHELYKKEDWINRPSVFAEQVVQYFPDSGSVLELGCGQAQDGCYFAEQGYDVTATDIEDSALELAKEKAKQKNVHVTFKNVDLSQALPFEDSSYDVVYAHLSLHYFDHQTTQTLFKEIERVLKPGGVLAFLTNSVNDPEYNTGTPIEADFFQIDETPKRYFSVATTGEYTQAFHVVVLDEAGETYKDSAKGVHNLVRFVGTKPTKA